MSGKHSSTSGQSCPSVHLKIMSLDLLFKLQQHQVQREGIQHLRTVQMRRKRKKIIITKEIGTSIIVILREEAVIKDLILHLLIIIIPLILIVAIEVHLRPFLEAFFTEPSRHVTYDGMITIFAISLTMTTITTNPTILLHHPTPHHLLPHHSIIIIIIHHPLAAVITMDLNSRLKDIHFGMVRFFSFLFFTFLHVVFSLSPSFVLVSSPLFSNSLSNLSPSLSILPLIQFSSVRDVFLSSFFFLWSRLFHSQCSIFLYSSLSKSCPLSWQLLFPPATHLSFPFSFLCSVPC